MSGHDDLLRQLRAGVRALGAQEAASGETRGAEPEHGGDADVAGSGDPRGRDAERPHRTARLRGAHATRYPWRGRRRGLLVALMALAVGGGVATAAQVGVIQSPHEATPDHPLSAREVARDAVVETRDSAACRQIKDDKSTTTMTTEIASAATALLAGPPDARAQAEALTFNHGGPVVAGSARRVDFSDKSHALVWVAVGYGPGSLVDPVACGAARIEQLHKDKPDPSSRLRQKAEAVLRGFRDIIPGLQMLNIMFIRADRNGAGGTGIPLDGRTIKPGVLFYGSGDYVGLAPSRAVRVTADGRGLHRSAKVHDRLFVVDLPRGTGHVTLRQRAADGRVLATQTIRK